MASNCRAPSAQTRQLASGAARQLPALPAGARKGGGQRRGDPGSRRCSGLTLRRCPLSDPAQASTAHTPSSPVRLGHRCATWIPKMKMDTTPCFSTPSSLPLELRSSTMKRCALHTPQPTFFCGHKATPGCWLARGGMLGGTQWGRRNQPPRRLGGSSCKSTQPAKPEQKLRAWAPPSRQHAGVRETPRPGPSGPTHPPRPHPAAPPPPPPRNPASCDASPRRGGVCCPRRAARGFLSI